jgi:hypothetical protein
MKKISLFLSALLISAISMAATVTMDFTSAAGLEAIGIPYPTKAENDGAYSSNLVIGQAYTQEGASLTVTKKGSTDTRIWLAAKGTMDLRHYKGGVLTFSAPAGSVITKIVFAGGSITGLENLNNKTWEGTAPSVDIPAAAGASTIKINTITITYEASGTDVVATPIIRGENDFRKTSEISIEAAAGMEVYYTLDGTDPTTASTKYAAPFTISETTTVKAIAYDAAKAKASEVVSTTFSKMQTLTCAEAAALCTSTATTEKYIIHGYVTEIKEAFNAQYGNITFWMADTKDGGQVLQAYRVKPVSEVEKNLQVGDYVEVIGTLVLFYDTPEVNAGGSVEKIEEPGTSAVDNVVINKQATKFFENGQLVIMKDGIRYNAQGQVL